MTPPWILLFYLFGGTLSYDLVHDYSGTSFFDKWDFFGNYDNLTLGDVWWLNREDAFAQGLAYVNSAGNAIIKVDNMHNVAYNQKRNSVRITTQESYSVGSLWIIDVKHVPFGCSVWPAFWTLGGPTWPEGGEIDIIEAINLMPNNQMALHTTSGCFHAPEPEQYQISTTLETDCSDASGCTVLEVQENSYLTGLAAAGGAVWATQFDVAGIFIWFWSRPNVPASITNSNFSAPLDVSQWGPPSASYPAKYCNITEFFSPQKLILDITLCGSWAGLPNTYFPSCGGAGPTGTCYADSVVGPGSNFNDAYFEVSYIKAYTTGGPAPTPNAAIEIPSHTAPTGLIASGLSPSTPSASPLFYPGSGGAQQATISPALVVLAGIIAGVAGVRIL